MKRGRDAPWPWVDGRCDGLGKELQLFSCYVSLGESELWRRERAIADIRSAILAKWPAALVRSVYNSETAVPHSVLSVSVTGASADAVQHDKLLSQQPWAESVEPVEQSAVIVGHTNGSWVTLALQTQGEYAKSCMIQSWHEQADRSLPHFRSTVQVLMHLEPFHHNVSEFTMHVLAAKHGQLLLDKPMVSDPARTKAGVLLPTAAGGALRSFFDYYGR